MSHTMNDQELMEELQLRFERSRKAFSDLTTVTLRLREVNQKLEYSERLKSNFLSNIRNEISDPMGGLLVLSSQIMAQAAQSPEVARLAGLIHHEALNLVFQLRNIFMAAELEAGASHPCPTKIPLESLLKDTLEDFQPVADHASVSLNGSVLSQDGNPPALVVCDSEKLALIMANLVSNAIKFNKPGGAVTVTLGCLNDGLQVQVVDTGIGILEEDIPKIFARFSQLDTGSTRTHLGHGLGLCIVRSLVDLLDGRIEIHSQPQTGSSFTVWLPDLQTEAGAETYGVGSNLFLFDHEPDQA